MDVSIRRLPGIGIRREKLFARLGVATIPGLLQYFPRDYEDRSHVVPIGRADLERKEPVLVCGRDHTGTASPPGNDDFKSRAPR